MSTPKQIEDDMKWKLEQVKLFSVLFLWKKLMSGNSREEAQVRTPKLCKHFKWLKWSAEEDQASYLSFKKTVCIQS